VRFARHVAAVARKELQAASRRRAPFVLRATFGAALSFAVAAWFHSETRVPLAWAASMTSQLFRGLVWCQAITALAASAALGFGSARAELRDKTLGICALSGLTAIEWVLGKALALSVLCGGLLLAGLPPFALLGWGGGLDERWLLALALLSALFAVLGAALGLLAGLFFRSALAATVALSATIVVVAFPIWVTDPPHVSPIWAIEEVASQGQDAGRIFSAESKLAMLAATAACLALAAVRVRAAVGRGGELAARRSLERLDGAFVRLDPSGVTFGDEPRGVRGNPVAWVTRVSAGLGRWRYLVRFTVLAAAISVGWLVLVADHVKREPAVLTYTAALALGAPALFAAAGGSAVAGERQRKTLLPLLATPLRAGQILRGKARAFALPGAALAAVLACLPIVLGSVGAPTRDRWVFTVEILATALFAHAASLAFSLRLETAMRATLAALVTLFLLWCAVLWLAAVSNLSFTATFGLETALIALLAVFLWFASAQLFDRAVGRAE
jgi:hypothetical protein